MTLVMVSEPERILLAMKKRGFGEGRWNGFGGKVHDGETIEEAAVREMEEEGGIVPISMVKAGLLTFAFQSQPLKLEVHIFKVTSFSGAVTETEEMRPQWFPWERVPYEQMWSDDRYWLPLLQDNQCFVGHFLFDAPATSEHEGKIVTHTLAIVDAL